MKRLLLSIFVLTVAACGPSDTRVERPEAMRLSEDALGHYCQMNLINHEGPKAQIHLAGHHAPLWFSQVRDGIAFIKAGERPADVVAFYVNDMGDAATWADPGVDNWIAAEDAVYVVGSNAVGGMGAPEVVPFLRHADAEMFAASRGGAVLSLADIPVEIVLAPVETAHRKEAEHHDQ